MQIHITNHIEIVNNKPQEVPKPLLPERQYVGPYGNGVGHNEPQTPCPKTEVVGPYGNGVAFGE